MELKRTVLRLLLAAASLMGVSQVLADAPSVAVTNCAGEAVPNPAYGATTGGHAVWLPGIGTNFVFIPTPGTFIQFPDGTATLSGTVFSKTNSQNGFIVDVQLSGFRTTPPSGSPKKDLSSNAYESGGPIDPSTWVYYTSFTGTLTGLDNYAGAVLTLVRTGPAFQVGFGANNKNINFGASAWFIWTVTRQPDNGSILTPTGQGDFNIDLFPCDNVGEQCVTNANADSTFSSSSTTHAVFLPGIATDFIFDPPGRFTQSSDGTATLTGLAVSRANPSRAFQVNAHFAGFTTDVPPGSPKKDLKLSAYIQNGGPVDPSTWSYYTTLTGTLVGVSNYSGAVLKVVRAGPAFQIGVGANGKNAHNGASGWFNWTVTHQPSSGSLPNGQGDFNVDLVDCPGSVVIVNPPTDQIACPGDSATFSVTATGTGLTYQWLFGGNPLNGATNSTLILPSVSAADAGIYCVIVTGADGVSVTSCANLVVNENVIVTTPPANQTVCPGDTALFSVTASGTRLTFQWYFGTTLLGGETRATLVLSNVALNQGGTYSVVVSGACAPPVTNSAALNVSTNVIVTTPPANQAVCSGDTAVFSVTATGNALAYQWYFGGTPLAGQTASTLVLNSVTLDQAGTYSVVVSGACGNPVTNSASLAVNQNAIVTTPPRDQAICAGETAIFRVTATGGALTYQWYFGAAALPGATNSVLVLSNATPAQAGIYSVVVSGACASSVTNSATLTVNQNVIVTVPPVDQTNFVGSNVTFTVTASGAVLGYQWFFGTNVLAGETNSTLALNNITTNQAGIYCVVVSGICGEPATNCATLKIANPPGDIVIVTPPANQTNCPGTTASFSVTATGTALTYQWLFGANVLNGQTNTTLVVTNVSAADAGTYCVVVTGVSGSVTNCALLVVNQNVVVARAPTDRTVCPGATANFVVSATGTALTYQWYFGTNALTGQTASSLVLSNVQPSQAGTYAVVVSGACAPAVTSSATLTVSTNVIVTVPLANQTNCSGTTVTFSVTALGTGLRYQWIFGTNILAGQTNSTLIVSNVTAANAGTYFVIVSGTCGGPVTEFANLVVNENVIVTTPPANQTVCPGETATFRVTATGTALSYQWYFGSTPLNGQNGSTLVLTNVAPAQAGTYSVVVAGACAPSVTNSATLTVNTRVTVIVPPSDLASCPEGQATFSVVAAGTALRYQWFFFGTNILVGQTNSTLVLNSVTVANTGVYSVIVSGACAPAVTNSATLTVTTNLIVTAPPANQTNCPGTTATFSVTAMGTGLRYQWFFGTNALANQTNSTLVLSSVTPAQAGTYRVVITGACGGPVSNSAILVLNENTVVTTPPANQAVCPGQTATFSVSATGNALTYQWYFAAGPLVGQTGSTLVLTNVAPAQAGTYRVVVSGACAPSVTNSATLTVSTNVIVTVPPANQTSCPGTTATFSVTAIGTGLRYQWFFGTNSLVSQTNSVLLVSNVTTASAGVYAVVVSGTCGGPVTNSATLTVSTNVIVTVPPANQTNCPGTTATFSVTAIGMDLRYQWFFATNVLAGQTNSALVLSNVTPAQTGTYRVVVTGACGSPLTNSANLVLNENVVVTTPPANRSVCQGETATFSVSATGSALTYQWYFGVGPLIGQTSSTLVLTNVAPAQAGTYRVVVSGACAPPVTNSATLTVTTNVIVTVPPANQTNCLGTTASFSVTALGAALRYQWIFGTNVLANQTNSTLVLTNVSVANAGTYFVIVSGACGNPVTNFANLVISQNVIVTTPPANQTSVVGSNAVFSVSASGSGLTFQWTFNGTVVGTNATLTLTNLAANQAGTYCVVVSGICGPRTTNCATLTLVNRPPVARDDAYSTLEDVPLVIAAPGVLINDTDPDGDTLTAVLLAGPSRGTLMLSNNGSFVYVPATNFNGLDSFLYRTFDGLVLSSPASVRITVVPTNDPPVAADDSYTTPENTTLMVPTLGVLANDVDVDGDPLMAVLVAGPTNGTVTLFPNGSFTYVPRTNFFGVDVFTYRASDGALQSGVARVTITVTRVFQPPTVMIVSPTNGSTFIAPANFAVIADAMDLDGVVTNVQIFSSTNLIGNFTNAPYLVLRTNLPPGLYTYFATATDNDGLRATSSVVSIVVTSTPPVTAVGPIVLDRETGLFSQFVRVSNPTPQDFVNGVRVFIQLPPALTNLVVVWNANGTNASGLPYVDSSTPVPSGSNSIVLIQYYSGMDRVVPTNVVLTAEPLPFGPAPMPQPTVIGISQSAGGTTVEFTTEKKCHYYLQCSDDLVHWHTVPGVINGSGIRMQCTEQGSVQHRFYRVMVFR